MEISSTSPSQKIPRSIPGKIFDFFSGFGLATVTLLLLGVLTWLATLEQIDNGLYPTLEKYFHHKSLILFPEIYINGKYLPIPPLPGGYYVCAVLLVNMVLGGIIRISKGWNHVGNLVSHFGIIFMLIGGGVSHHFSERGNMAIWEGETSNVAEDYYEYTVEVAEVKDGKTDKVYVVRGKDMVDLENKKRLFRLPNLPFDLELGGYLKNAVPVAVSERAPDRQQQKYDGYFLAEKPKLPKAEEAELYTAGCYAQIFDRASNKKTSLILAGANFHPFTYQYEDRVFTIDMRKFPFTLKLDQFTADFHPGTMRPSKFVSKVTRVENNNEAKFTVQMNEPMRYDGMTFFQASYGPSNAKPGDKMYSVFEVVRNPADKWPEYSLYIVAIGMAVTFLTKLIGFIAGGSTKKRHV